MSVKGYEKLVLETLEGKILELRDVPPQRLDWNGVGALLQLFDRTYGKDRTAIIQAIGNIIQRHGAPIPVIAELVQIASSLDLAEVEPNVRALQQEPVASEEPLRSSIVNFLAYRSLSSQSNGKAEASPLGRTEPVRRPARNKSPAGASAGVKPVSSRNRKVRS